MTVAEFFQAVAGLSGLLFVVASMLAMGMSLTIPQILVVTTQNFPGTDTLPFVLVGAVLLLLILLPTAKRIGARAAAAAPVEVTAA
jgi:hypothetical protein